MLVGRDRELEALRGRVARASAGEGGALVVRGEAGIGKTALLDECARGATACLVLRARALEDEGALPFAGLGDLVEPLLDRLPALPGPQADALAGALALRPASAGDRFAVAAAAVSLLREAARGRPVLAVCDDAHWLDAGSREALLFAARRLASARVLLVLAARPEEDFTPADLPVLELRPLARSDAAQLLAVEDPALAERILEAAAGNPLALLELPAALSPGQRDGLEPLDDPLPTGRTLARVYERRLRSLPESSRRALLLAAAGSGEPWAFPVGELEPAEREGLVSIAPGGIEFRHPLLRSAVYHGAEPGERRAAHRLLAERATGAARARHLAAAATGPDERAAAALAEAGEDAFDRAGYAAAARAFETAAALTPDAERRARRLLAAADAAQVAGEAGRALELLDAALRLARGPVLRADVQHLRGRVELHRDPRRAHALLAPRPSGSRRWTPRAPPICTRTPRSRPSEPRPRSSP